VTAIRKSAHGAGPRRCQRGHRQEDSHPRRGPAVLKKGIVVIAVAIGGSPGWLFRCKKDKSAR
jgi:hypothetical protein